MAKEQSTPPRPLGELLDEGYLTQERFEQAARCANPLAGTSMLESEIDHAQRVAPRQLSLAGMIYGLTEDEVRIVESKI